MGLERRIDQDLKGIYRLAGMVCIENVHSILKGVSEELTRGLAVQEFKLVVAFLGEASIGLICLLARTMLSSVRAKRTLWL